MPISQEGERETASALATLGTKRRVQIPKACMDILTWPKDDSVELIAELFEPGRVRLYLADKILPKIRAMRTEVQGSNTPDRLELLCAIEDKFNEAMHYTKGEHSVTLEKRIEVYLGVLPQDDRQVFVEATKETIDIMSLTYRNRRLQLLKDSISV